MPQGAGAVKRIKVVLTRNGERIVLRLKRKVNVYNIRYWYIVESSWTSMDGEYHNKMPMYEAMDVELAIKHLNDLVKNLIKCGYGIKKATKGFYETAEDD